MSRLILSFILSLSFFYLNAQISFIEEPQVRVFMDYYEQSGKEDDAINGWRIKLVSTTDRRKLENTKYRFDRSYPNISSSTDYENPYYSLKAGAFESRYDVEPFLVKFKQDFREAIPFRDKILKSELFTSE